MHGLRRPSYDCNLRVPNDSLKRYSLRTIHEPQQYSLRELTLRNCAGMNDKKSSWRNGSIVNYLASRFSLSDGSPEFQAAMIRNNTAKYDWAIYMGISLAFVVLLLSLTMLYVIANQNASHLQY